MTVLGAAVRSAAAGALGTAAMDALWYHRYRRADGRSGFVDWETSAGLHGWEGAPAPAKFGRLLAHLLYGITTATALNTLQRRHRRHVEP